MRSTIRNGRAIDSETLTRLLQQDTQQLLTQTAIENGRQHNCLRILTSDAFAAAVVVA
jgi:hypothetical protein